MGMTQKSFETALKKGELGEQIVREWLEKRGWVVYFPFTKDRAHYFDMFATKNKEQAVAIDVKTKARFNNFAAQGIDLRAYKQYMNFVEKTKVKFYVVFVDDKCGDVHACEIAKMTKCIHVGQNIIAWYLKDMWKLFKISEAQIQELSQYDQRNYKYNPVK